MSYEYDEYLKNHKENVVKAYQWLNHQFPELIDSINQDSDLNWQIEYSHDSTKESIEEYDAYDAYFYGGNKSYAVVQAFNQAWLIHIHKNPHHWQHWVLIQDDPGKDILALDMPDDCIIHMICDWWSFSWVNGDLTTIFKWYDDHKDYMKLSEITRRKVEGILDMIRGKLEMEEKNNDGV